MTLKQNLDTAIRALPGVERRRSRFSDAQAYFVGTREFAHFHGSSVVDIRLTRGVIRELDLRGQDDPRIELRGSSSDWIAYHFARRGDLERAIELLEHAHAVAQRKP